MANRKIRKLAKHYELNIDVQGPFTDSDVLKREDEYTKLSDVAFKKAWRHYLFKPAAIVIDNVLHEIQYNFCTNQFCKWFGLPQLKYDSIKGKPSRYKQESDPVEGERIKCNDVPDPNVKGESIEHKSSIYSNWSICYEIWRLIAINTTIPHEPEYQFHKDGCIHADHFPEENPSSFYRKGKSSSNSQKYQCKFCNKCTNVLPTIEKCFSYHQQRNDILIDFAKDILSRTPIKRTCEKLNIGSQTYYDKLELLYQRCLEFLERHETETLKSSPQRDNISITTDYMIYNLNNTKQKSSKKSFKEFKIKKKFQTYIITSAEVKSGYILRSDLAYDSIVIPEDIALDTLMNKADHSYSYLRIFDRLTDPYTAAPVEPTALDTQSYGRYVIERNEFITRTLYVNGSHVKATYTAIAHFWLLRNLIQSKKWNFLSDNDASLQSAVFRVFSDKIKDLDAHYFVYKYEKKLSAEDAYKESTEVRNHVRKWAISNGLGRQGVYKRSLKYLNKQLENHDFLKYENINGNTVPVGADQWISHPMPPLDQGKTEILCITDTRKIPNSKLAGIIIDLNGWAVNNFYQILRRKVSILERPLVTARQKDGKSYIYANYNPKYAQQLITITRTFYNFCWEQKVNGEKVTPAMRFGLATKKYDIQDIIYLK